MNRHTVQQKRTSSNCRTAELPSWSIRYYHNDHLGTPRELTGDDGSVQWAATYKAWGNTLQVKYAALTQHDYVDREKLALQQQEELEQPLRFQGQYFDSETGLHYNRFRYYDPDCGRFVNQDPIGLDGGNNLYQYAPNPTILIDIFGLQKCKPCPIDCEKILSDEGVITGRHGDLRKIGGLQDSHHIYQDAAMKGIPGYKYNDAVAISIQGRHPSGKTGGTPHHSANQTQNTAKIGDTLGSETVVAFKSLRSAGLSPQAAKCATLKARGYLAGIGGNAGTATEVPSKGKIP